MQGAQVVLDVGAHVRVRRAEGRVAGGREANQRDVGDDGSAGGQDGGAARDRGGDSRLTEAPEPDETSASFSLRRPEKPR